ncbi:DNA fragmentation factor subunit alpha [Solea senegalensis]|uniref:DNAation factor subunit alpha n=1 Tax=Solea senegalensis TaxID=28829 RepID=A0AAV6SWQ9_SOLSE|nr:DNA fragmentation factor subunit alpha [Solea senegalensis]
MTDRRPCRVCNFTRQKSYGLVVPSLDDLKIKGSEFLGFSPREQVTVVLENDGTIVEDQAYFLCLPPNTKFMLLHDKDLWSPLRRMDGGTAWMARESVILESDTVDANIDVPPWCDLAHQLKQDLASIILMSEADIQTLVDAPCPELASALRFQEKTTESLQESLQRFLDRKEEERQSKELLQLYLKAVEKEDMQQEEQGKSSLGGMAVCRAAANIYFPNQFVCQLFSRFIDKLFGSCQKMLKNVDCFFPNFKIMMFSNVSFCPQTNVIQFFMIYLLLNKENRHV